MSLPILLKKSYFLVKFSHHTFLIKPYRIQRKYISYKIKNNAPKILKHSTIGNRYLESIYYIYIYINIQKITVPNKKKTYNCKSLYENIRNKYYNNSSVVGTHTCKI